MVGGNAGPMTHGMTVIIFCVIQVQNSVLFSLALLVMVEVCLFGNQILLAKQLIGTRVLLVTVSWENSDVKLKFKNMRVQVG